MSDLAPFVAAVLRDKVVTELVEENNRLKRKVEQLEETVEKNGSHTLEIGAILCEFDDAQQLVGVNPVVYAKAQIDEDGWEMGVDNISRWCVDLTTEPGVSCHYSRFDHDLEMTLWGNSKQLVQGGDDEFAYFRDYHSATQKLDFTFGVAPYQVLLHGSLGPVSPEVVAKLRQQDECPLTDFVDVMDQAVGNKDERKSIMLEFEQVKFNNHAHTLWNLTDE